MTNDPAPEGTDGDMHTHGDGTRHHHAHGQTEHEHGPRSVRQCADFIVNTIEPASLTADVTEMRGLLTDLVPRIQELIDRADLDSLTIKRAGQHFDEVGVLYYDTELEILLGRLSRGKRLQAHDHGVWQLLIGYHGRVRHVSYSRSGNLTSRRSTGLRVVEEQLMGVGDWAILVPPDSDIHSVEGIAESSYVISISPTRNLTRRYFDDDGNYIQHSMTR